MDAPVRNCLEALVNLLYLIRSEAPSCELTTFYLDTADDQLSRLITHLRMKDPIDSAALEPR